MKYQHLFFDLDHTLWDFKSNARTVLNQLYQQFIAPISSVSLTDFVFVYEARNKQLWDQFNRGEVDKDYLRERRFPDTLSALLVDPKELSIAVEQLDQWYLTHCSQMGGVFEGTYACLSQLKAYYPLHLITNGFGISQYQKLRAAGLESFFSGIFISDELGMRKPNADIFEYAMEQVGASAAQSLMIGDSLEADIMGAQSVQMDQVWFNPENESNATKIQPTYEIHELLALPPLLDVPMATAQAAISPSH